MRAIILFLFIALVNSTYARQTTVDVEPFHNFHVFGPFTVTLIKSTKEKVEIDYRDYNKEDVQIKSSGSDLSIKFKNKDYFNSWDSDNRGPRIRVKVYFTELSGIEARGGSHVSSNDVIESRDMYLTCSMGSEMELNVKAEELELNSSMGSDVELSGTAKSLDLSAKMGSDVKAEKLICEDVSVHASMGADVFVYASRKLDISAGFGASVDYTGTAAVNHTSKFFGADIQSRRR
jgi:hypothetical protein